MKAFKLFIALCLMWSISSSQEEWSFLHPLPTIIDLFDAHFVSDDEGWVVGKEGLILHTDDGGLSWDTQHKNENEYFEGVFFVNDSAGWVCGWGDIYHTIDGGENWELQNTPPAAGGLTDVFFLNQDTGWIVGYYKTVLKTTDRGETWLEMITDIDDISVINDIEFIDENNGCLVGGYLGGSGGGFVMNTQDGGLSWTETTPDNCSFLKGVNYYNDMCVWICGRDGGLYRSLDGGSKWFVEYFGPGEFNDINFFDDDNGLILSSNYVRMTFDGGNSWDSVSFVNPTTSGYYSFMSWDDDKGIAVGFDGLISLTENGGSDWSHFGDGLRMASSNLGFFDNNNGLAIHAWGQHAYLLKTSDGGYTWMWDTLVPHGHFYDLFMDGQSCYLLNKSSQLVKSYDAGINWEVTDIPPLADYYSDFQFVNENSGFICGYDGEFLRTQDGGQSWESFPFNNSYNITDLFFVNESHGWLIYFDGKEILRTSDGGETWSSSQAGSLIHQPKGIYFIDPNIGFLATEEGFLYKTDDGGENWAVISEFEGLYSTLHFISETEGFCTNGSSIFHTVDGGQSWSEQGPFGSVNPIRSLYFLTEDVGWLGGSGGLIARYNGTVEISEQSLKPNALMAYPNPFSTSTTIEYELNRISNVQFTVYNIQGVVVFETEKRSVTPGLHKVTWSQSHLSGGMYYAVLRTDDGVSVVKMVKK